MKNKKTLLIIVLAFVVLMGGAYVLYDRLGDDLAPDQLAPQQPETPDYTEETEPGDTEESEGFIAPDFTVYDADGNAVNLHDYFGKPIVLNFWASWCSPCKSEMPDFHDKYKEIGEDVQFIMLNMTGGRETLESAMEFIAGEGYTFPVLYDIDSDAAMTYGVYSLPTTFFIDAEGYGIAKATGAIDAATLQRGIDMIT